MGRGRIPSSSVCVPRRRPRRWFPGRVPRLAARPGCGWSWPGPRRVSFFPPPSSQPATLRWVPGFVMTTCRPLRAVVEVRHEAFVQLAELDETRDGLLAHLVLAAQLLAGRLAGLAAAALVHDRVMAHEHGLGLFAQRDVRPRFVAVDHGDHGRVVVHVAHHRGHAVQADDPGGVGAPVAADDLVSSIRGSHQQRGRYADALDGFHEVVHRFVVVHAVRVAGELVEQVGVYLADAALHVGFRFRFAERSGQVAEVEVHFLPSFTLRSMA